MRITTPEVSLPWKELGTGIFFFLLSLCKTPKGAISNPGSDLSQVYSFSDHRDNGNMPCLLKSVWISVTLLMESELKGKPLPTQRATSDVLGMAWLLLNRPCETLSPD